MYKDTGIIRFQIKKKKKAPEQRNCKSERHKASFILIVLQMK